MVTQITLLGTARRKLSAGVPHVVRLSGQWNGKVSELYYPSSDLGLSVTPQGKIFLASIFPLDSGSNSGSSLGTGHVFFLCGNSKFWPKNGRFVPDRETRIWLSIQQLRAKLGIL